MSFVSLLSLAPVHGVSPSTQLSQVPLAARVISPFYLGGGQYLLSLCPGFGNLVYQKKTTKIVMV